MLAASGCRMALSAYCRSAQHMSNGDAQEVVVLGSGAFACEAMVAAIANNAKHVTMFFDER